MQRLPCGTLPFQLLPLNIQYDFKRPGVPLKTEHNWHHDVLIDGITIVAMSRRVHVLLALLLFSVSLLAQSPESSAKPDLAQEAFVFEHLNESVRFENDGSGARETTAAIRINSQAGVQ